MSNLKKLQDLAAKAKAAVQTENLSFPVTSLEAKATESAIPKVNFRATLTNGKVVTFWESNMAELVEPSADGNSFLLKAGVTILEDGALIPPGSKWAGVWTD